MENKSINILDELIRASSLLSGEIDFKKLVSVLVEQAIDVTHSDIASLYLYSQSETNKEHLTRIYKRGRYTVPDNILKKSGIISFLEDCEEAVLLLERKKSPFTGIFLHPEMESGIALPVLTPAAKIGVLFLNSRTPMFYNKKKFQFLTSFVKLAGGMLHNSKLFQELKDYLRQIEELERYQKSIFSSMTNLLVTTDNKGDIKYFNNSAQERMNLSESVIGTNIDDFFKDSIGKKIIKTVDSIKTTGQEILGLEGIYKSENIDMDYSLNISPLQGKRGRHEGLTLLFTDQTRERELKEKMNIATEERRVIKDMFSRYLSNEIVQNLMATPALVKPGGGQKQATVFFADIRGYTSFSEGKDPEYIIEILNEYFSEAVEIVIRHKGYIDKFIGDCIMAAWGVPVSTEREDAVHAVSCAMEIQQLVNSKDRNFFKGKASSLKIGIGMHTGPLVAGNLGSSRRMDYTVIGDTVNVAARLEGVAGPGDIIITQNTRDYIGDAFRLKQLEPVKVKGKTKVIPIYNVIGMS